LGIVSSRSVLTVSCVLRSDGAVVGVRDILDPAGLLHVGAQILKARVARRVGGLLLLRVERLRDLLLLLRGLRLRELRLLLLVELVDLRLVRLRGRLGEVGRDQELAVLAGAEALAEQVVGLSRLRVGRQRPVVLLAEVEVAHREGHHREHDQRDEQEDHRARGHDPRPARPAVRLAIAPAVRQRDAEALQARPQQREHRREERDRREHGDRDHDRGGVPERGHERHVDDDQREQRDDHRAAREHDRAARGRHRARDRLRIAHPLAHLVAVAGDYEQRVVDPDAQADHRRERGRGRRQLHDVPQQRDHREPGDEPDDRGGYRDAHRDRGAEREQQHDDRGAQADDLAQLGRGLGDLLAEVATEGDLQPGVRKPVVVARELLRLVGRELARAGIEVQRDEADPPVLGEVVRAPAAQRVDRLAHRRVAAERGGRARDRRRVARLAELVPLGRGDHHGVGPVRLRREALVQQVGGVLAVGSRQRQVVVGLRPERRGPGDQAGEDRQPDAEHQEAAADAEAPEGVQGAGHLGLVGGRRGARAPRAGMDSASAGRGRRVNHARSIRHHMRGRSNAREGNVRRCVVRRAPLRRCACCDRLALALKRVRRRRR